MPLTSILDQIDAEISLLQRAREILAGASPSTQKSPAKKAGKKLSQKKKREAPTKQPILIAASRQSAAPVTAILPLPEPEPQIQRVPPKRRVERKQVSRPVRSQTITALSAALSGPVPAGPVAVSANEASRVQEQRKAQERIAPEPSEPLAEIGSERTLGSLVRAFERRTRQN